MNGPKSSRDFVAIAEQYSADVLAGTIPACKWVKLACQRQVDDLSRTRKEWLERGSATAWTFDHERASKVCRFIELLPHIKGKWKSKNITLEPWQIWHLTTIFGWVDAAGNRRFRTVYLEEPRKNAKSTETAGVALFCLCENEPGAECFSAATKKDQAKIVWEIARNMVRRCPGLRSRFGVETSAGSIHVEERAATFVPLSSDEDGLDGLNLYFGSVDELHAHKTGAVWDVLDTATGARDQALLWAITTAGWNQAGVCYEQRTYLTDILSGAHQDDRYFGVIYSIDLPEKLADGTEKPGDDWRDPQSWIKANPNYGVSVKPNDIAAIARKAMRSARSQNTFLTKRLNVWVTAEESYFNMNAWRTRCYEPTLRIEDFTGVQCFDALDLASKVDLTAKVRVYRRNGHYYAFGRYWLPDDVVSDEISGNCEKYAAWAEDGHLELTDGSAIDLDLIEQYTRDDALEGSPAGIAYDPWHADQLRQHLEKDGFPMEEFRQGFPSMTGPMSTLDALIRAGKIHHNGDPVLTWAMGNVIGKRGPNDAVRPDKQKDELKIDPAVALIMAIGLAYRQEDEGTAGFFGL